MSFAQEFRLAGREGDKRYPRVSAAGAFIGDDLALLERDPSGRWRPRQQHTLEKMLGRGYGVPVDLGWRMDRLGSVARALNKGDLSLAAIALVHAELPPLPLGRLRKDAAAVANEPRDAKGRWVASATGDQIIALAHTAPNAGWLKPSDVHPGNEKECVSLVRAAIPGLDRSGTWRKGEKITEDGALALEPGTAIATFRADGTYGNEHGDHAAIFQRYGKDGSGRDGIFVIDQFNQKIGEVKERFYPFTRRPHENGYSAGQFSTIAKSSKE